MLLLVLLLLLLLLLRNEMMEKKKQEHCFLRWLFNMYFQFALSFASAFFFSLICFFSLSDIRFAFRLFFFVRCRFLCVCVIGNDIFVSWLLFVWCLDTDYRTLLVILRWIFQQVTRLAFMICHIDKSISMKSSAIIATIEIRNDRIEIKEEKEEKKRSPNLFVWSIFHFILLARNRTSLKNALLNTLLQKNFSSKYNKFFLFSFSAHSLALYVCVRRNFVETLFFYFIPEVAYRMLRHEIVKLEISRTCTIPSK